MDSSNHDDLFVSDVFTPQADLPPPRIGFSAESRSDDLRLHDRSASRKLRGSRGERTEGTQPGANGNSDAFRDRARQRKKKKTRPGHEAVPALSTVRGFTPITSGDEESDISSTCSKAPNSRPLSAYRTSPKLQSSSSCGVSALKAQLSSLNLSDNALQADIGTGLGSGTPSSMSVCSDSDQTEVLTSYEVPLESNFISTDAVAEEKSRDPQIGKDARSELCRKMSADDFEPLLCLGKGSFGTVILVRHVHTGKLYAQKQFRKASITVHKKLVEQTKTERMILESVNRHPSVVKLFYAFQDQEKLYLILEYAEGGELFHHLAMERMFDEDVAAFYMAEMVLALEHLHQSVGVIYRDLKPENCLLDRNGHLLLTDFGLSKQISVDGDERCDSSNGTYEYMAPEVVRGDSYGKACDWWSLGALGYDLLTGSPPFQANNHAKLQEKIIKQKLTLPYFLGPDAKDLLTRLLRKDPSKRLGYHMPKDLHTIKKHRFFRKIDWKSLESRSVAAPINPVITDPALAENFSDEFTRLPLSPRAVFTTTATAETDSPDYFACPQPVSTGRHGVPIDSVASEDPFRGFSFVASSSLFDYGLGGCHSGSLNVM